MEQKYKIVIGISGAKNSGKDTAASMIHYIFKSGITNATYKEWALKYEQTRFKPTVIHFADYLKDMLSMLSLISLNMMQDLLILKKSVKM